MSISIWHRDETEDPFYTTLLGKVVFFFLPFLIAALYIYLLYIIMHDKSTFWLIGGGMSTYLFPPLGKESVIPILVTELTRRNIYSPVATILLVGGSIAYVDIVTSYFLLWNLYIAEKIPFLGEWIKKFEKFGATKMKEKKWISKVAMLGLALFVVFPFQGSGGVGASIIGKVIGMNKYRAWTAIIIGAFSGSIFYAFISYYLGEAILAAFRTSLFQGIGATIIVIVFFIIIYYFSKHRMNNFKNDDKGDK